MNDELLVKFLLKEASPEEEQAVATWLAKDRANEKKMEHFKLIWESSRKLALQNPIDADLAWERFQVLREQQEKLQKDSHPASISLVPKKKTSGGWLRIAASITISMGVLLGIYWYLIAPKHPYFHTIEIVSTDEPLSETLPDGTKITLNKHSKIAYTEKLFGKRRAVNMSGEVFFDVTRIPAIPFEINVKDVAIKVLGTSFNIKSNAKGTEVIVETGAVQVSRNDIVIKLKPDEKAIARAEEQGLEQKKQTDRLYDYYRSKVFKLDGTPLWRFVEVLNDVYQAQIVIENTAIANLPLNTAFENESLTAILNTICKTLQLRTEKRGNIITIKR